MNVKTAMRNSGGTQQQDKNAVDTLASGVLDRRLELGMNGSCSACVISHQKFGWADLKLFEF